ncbi:hypothetical protein BCR33DRAFT_717473 [Rhizoclosmatium globosum]|uniref:Uncharacterized protein n=1 Tax=Rhizoclosmatium globosum TaxID=329046 RepID=A0A1Y2CAA5_9FUNG|nr:hypothetical protein BCR33DRAFT_717473 [Rhizoclosmatium globosum]|eukprot:ORY43837.1 hypothetical protein BCR33DRAFT_717473 [Rhizoclosmatium globosum]
MFEEESYGLWIATLAGAITSHGIGFLFLCPNVLTRNLLSTNTYERIHGDSNSTPKSKNPHGINHGTRSLYSFLFDVIRSYIHLHLLLAFSSYTPTPLELPQALYSTLLIWVAYISPVFASDVFWEGRNCHTAVYSASRHLVSLLTVTAVFYAVDYYSDDVTLF